MATKPKTRTKKAAAEKGSILDKASFMPVSFKDFAKNPVVGTLFIAICGIGYIYMDAKGQNDAILDAQNKKISVLELKVDKLVERVRVSDSLMSSAQSKIKTLQELGKIN